MNTKWPKDLPQSYNFFFLYCAVFLLNKWYQVILDGENRGKVFGLFFVLFISESEIVRITMERLAHKTDSSRIVLT